MIRETYLFHVPNQTQYTVAAAAVLESFERMLLNRGDEFEFHVMGIPLEARFLFNGLRTHASLVTEPMTEYDVEFTFDAERAWNLAKDTHRHVTDAFGIMLGVDQPQIFPTLIPKESNTDGILILDYGQWNGRRELIEIVGDHYPDASRMVIDDPTWSVAALFDVVARHTLVLGTCGVGTYMAAALGKTVVEFYPTDLFPEFLSKQFGGRNYTMLWAAPNAYSATLVWRLIKNKPWRYLEVGNATPSTIG